MIARILSNCFTATPLPLNSFGESAHIVFPQHYNPLVLVHPYGYDARFVFINDGIRELSPVFDYRDFSTFAYYKDIYQTIALNYWNEKKGEFPIFSYDPDPLSYENAFNVCRNRFPSFEPCCEIKTFSSYDYSSAVFSDLEDLSQIQTVDTNLDNPVFDFQWSKFWIVPQRDYNMKRGLPNG